MPVLTEIFVVVVALSFILLSGLNTVLYHLSLDWKIWKISSFFRSIPSQRFVERQRSFNWCVFPLYFCNKHRFPLLLPGYAIFKLTYLSNHDYKPLYFESDASTVNEIVLKVSLGCMFVRFEHTET